MKRTDVILSVGTLVLALYEKDTIAFLEGRLGGLSGEVGQTVSSLAKEMR